MKAGRDGLYRDRDRDMWVISAVFCTWLGRVNDTVKTKAEPFRRRQPNISLPTNTKSQVALKAGAKLQINESW